jgi:hypothetical protein
MTRLRHLADGRAKSYASATDFINIFTQQMDTLYLLSLLLTADEGKAEQCFVCAMKDCADGTRVLKGWELSWARQVVLKSAIQMLAPMPVQADSLPPFSFGGRATSAENSTFATILALSDFERFVFVMLFLEKRTELECAILLRCSRRDVTIARALALKHLATRGPSYSYHSLAS